MFLILVYWLQVMSSSQIIIIHRFSKSVEFSTLCVRVLCMECQGGRHVGHRISYTPSCVWHCEPMCEGAEGTRAQRTECEMSFTGSHVWILGSHLGVHFGTVVEPLGSGVDWRKQVTGVVTWLFYYYFMEYFPFAFLRVCIHNVLSVCET